MIFVVSILKLVRMGMLTGARIGMQVSIYAGSKNRYVEHFACACVHPLNDNSVGASNLMAGNRKLA